MWTTHYQESGIQPPTLSTDACSKFPCYICRRESTHFYEIVDDDRCLGMCNEHYLMSFLQTKTYRELQGEELIVFKIMHS